MGFQPASGSCSTICKSLSTFFTGTNDLFTAWKIYGATRRDSNGKRPRRADCALVEVLVSSTCLTPVSVLHRSTATIYFFCDGGAAGLGGFAGAGTADAGAGAGFASISSTSKIRVELAARSALTALSP